jgi:hypothetical protein
MICLRCLPLLASNNTDTYSMYSSCILGLTQFKSSLKKRKSVARKTLRRNADKLKGECTCIHTFIMTHS